LDEEVRAYVDIVTDEKMPREYLLRRHVARHSPSAEEWSK
jgi:hypothetical protein